MERLVALCTSAHLRSWIEGEVADLVTSRHYAPTVADVTAVLAKGGASKAELLVLDLDLLSPPYTFELKAGLEERWWSGTIVGLGTARGIHRTYLELDRVLPRPLGSEALRAYVERSDGCDTQPIVTWPTGRSGFRGR